MCPDPGGAEEQSQLIHIKSIFRSWVQFFLQWDCLSHLHILCPSCGSSDKGALPSLSKQEASGNRCKG